MPHNARLIDQLDTFLLDFTEDDEVMLLSELDGFMAGLIVCPDLIMPSRWMPQIWNRYGSTNRGDPFDSEEQVQTMLDLVHEHFNSVISFLSEGTLAYEPIFEIDTVNDDVIWECWMEGFARAMELSPKSWLNIAASEDGLAIAALKGLQTLKDIVLRNSQLPLHEKNRLIAEAPKLIPLWVVILNDWRKLHGLESVVIRGPAIHKPGRNDPCHCGSSKKYKKCCGMN